MTAARTPVDVAVGILIRPDGRLLLASRPEGKPYAGYWEFPGGKLEAGRDGCARAQARTARRTRRRRRRRPSLGRPRLRLSARARSPALLPGVRVEWRTACAGAAALRILRAGCASGATAAGHGPGAPRARAAAGVRRQRGGRPGHRCVSSATGRVARPRAQARPAARARALRRGGRSALRRNARADTRGGSPPAREQPPSARAVGGGRWRPPDVERAGDHRRAARPSGGWAHRCTTRRNWRGPGNWASTSPCSARSRSTASHPGQSPLGWTEFERIAVGTPLPVYAIGGLDSEALPRSMACGAHGVALLSAAWRAGQCFDRSGFGRRRLLRLFRRAAGNHVAIGGPCAEVDHLAALGAERPELRSFAPFDRLAAGRALHHRRHRVERDPRRRRERVRTGRRGRRSAASGRGPAW